MRSIRASRVFAYNERAIGFVERRKAYKDGVTLGFQIWAAHFSCSVIACPLLYSIQLHPCRLRFGLPRHGLLCNRIRAPIRVHYLCFRIYEWKIVSRRIIQLQFHHSLYFFYLVFKKKLSCIIIFVIINTFYKFYNMLFAFLYGYKLL